MKNEPPTSNGSSAHKPYISADQSLPELTIKGMILGAALAALMGAANVYLGLKAGMTVSASIPAAVISMAVLRLFKRSNILENNNVQTAASSGESIAAGVIFTIPALVILGAWSGFNYWQTTAIATLGGILGLLFTIPLRRALVVPRQLKFPEGVAAAEVLKAGESGKGVKTLALGAIFGALFKIGSTGMELFGGVAARAWHVGGSVAYLGTELAPALVSVGFIVGLNISILIFLGGALNWWVAIPIVAATDGLPQADTLIDSMTLTWKYQTRYIGVGAMLVGGLWALIRLLPTLFGGAIAFLNARKQDRGTPPVRLRTEADTPMNWVLIGIGLCLIPMFFIFNSVTHDPMISAFMAVIMLIAGFFFSAVAGYMAGLVGSSNNPVSGMTIATLLTAALLLYWMGLDATIGPMATLFIGAVVCNAIAMGGDNIQDLKTGHILGATPWKQQIAQVIGVLAGAVVMAPVLTLLMNAYGIEGIESSIIPGKPALIAAQATLMESVARGVFAGGLPWNMVYIGFAVAALVISCDLILEKKKANFRTPVLAVAVGIYLPFYLGAGIFFGGIVAAFVNHYHKKRIASARDPQSATQLQEDSEHAKKNGVLLAAGLITGEAILGILLAIPLVLSKEGNPMAIKSISEMKLVWPGMVLFAVVLLMLYRAGTKKGSRQAA